MAANNTAVVESNSSDDEIQSLNSKDLRRIYLGNCTDVTLWRLRKNDETFPKPFTLSGTLLWSREAVQAWYDDKKASQLEAA